MTLAVATAAMFAMAYWFYRVIQEKPQMSGDQWYMTQFAFTDEPVSAPYCWRPLVPLLARRIGFKPVTYTAAIATPFLIYFYMGGGWTGVFAALLFVGNHNLFSFSIKNPEYADGLGQFLMISSVWAVSIHSPGAVFLLLLCGLCRETIAGALAVFVLFYNAWYLIPLALGCLAAYLERNEDKDNQHPLVEPTIYDTLKRWGRIKGFKSLHYAHTVQPLRALAFCVPFMWNRVDDLARLGLLSIVPIWMLAFPASGQSRIMCYGFVFLLPFFGALSPGWQAGVLLATWFWPLDIRTFDESGDTKFSFAR